MSSQRALASASGEGGSARTFTTTPGWKSFPPRDPRYTPVGRRSQSRGTAPVMLGEGLVAGTDREQRVLPQSPSGELEAGREAGFAGPVGQEEPGPPGGVGRPADAGTARIVGIHLVEGRVDRP